MIGVSQISDNSRPLRLLVGFLLLIVIFVFSWASVAEAEEPTGQETEPIRVVTKEIEPFVIKEQDRLTGFSIDLWEEIALETNLPFDFVEVEAVSDQIEAVEEGKADVGIAAIVYDSPVLQYYAATTEKRLVKLVGSPFKIEDYGIVLQTDSPYEEEINKALLEIIVTGTYQEIYDKWFTAEDG